MSELAHFHSFSEHIGHIDDSEEMKDVEFSTNETNKENDFRIVFDVRWDWWWGGIVRTRMDKLSWFTCKAVYRDRLDVQREFI